MHVSAYRKLVSLGALIALAGFVVSGPVGFIIVKITRPQPEWTSSAVFAEHYHIVQDFPYYFGFLLIGGMLMLASGHYLGYRGSSERIKFQLLSAFAWTAIFCALIAFNYISQTTFVRHLALDYNSGHDNAIAMFSMTNPSSLSWTIEMWGYGFLGLANLLTTGYYRGKSHFIWVLLIINGAASFFSVVSTIVDINWVMSTTGIILYLLWNGLMIMMMASIYRYARHPINGDRLPSGNV